MRSIVSCRALKTSPSAAFADFFDDLESGDHLSFSNWLAFCEDSGGHDNPFDVRSSCCLNYELAKSKLHRFRLSFCPNRIRKKHVNA